MASFRVDEVVRMVRVVFLHPDLGIGGAERLIVDCSLALQSKVEEIMNVLICSLQTVSIFTIQSCSPPPGT